MPIHNLIDFFKKNYSQFPAFLLLVFVYVFIIPRILSYEQAWVQPEQFYMKMGILSSGENLNIQDLKNGLCWQLFEYQPRPTRPLSSYFEIVDTKFRAWAWHYIMPHPSLSLTWIFSFVLAPIFLYFLLKNCLIGTSLALTMVAFYLVTPGVLSYEVMLFRPAKPMTNFFIIFCLYLASRLKKRYIDRQNPIPWGDFLVFWAVSAFSFYWDETAVLIFPAIFFFFPQVIRRKTNLVLWLSLPVITYFSYFKFIPYLTSLAGYGLPQLKDWNWFVSTGQTQSFFQSIQFLGINAYNLVLETMGFIIPDVFFAPLGSKVLFCVSWIAWGVVLYYVFKEKQKADLRLVFMAGILFLFNFLISRTMYIWGPYYYGSFWSVFFVIYLASYIEKTRIPHLVLVCCFFVILFNMSNSFLETNKIFKKYHYYPYNPWVIAQHFEHRRFRYEPVDKPAFSGEQIKSYIYKYWSQKRQGKDIDLYILPRELCWLPLELEPEKKHTWYKLLSTDYRNYIRGK